MFFSLWVLRIAWCVFFSMGSEDCFFLVCFCLWVLRIVLCVFVYMSSEDCFVCFCLYGF